MPKCTGRTVQIVARIPIDLSERLRDVTEPGATLTATVVRLLEQALAPSPPLPDTAPAALAVPPITRAGLASAARSAARRAHWEPAFIAALAAGTTVKAAMRQAGIGVTAAYRHRDQAFAQAWDQAYAAGLALITSAAGASPPHEKAA